MIGNPVSMPRVIEVATEYNNLANTRKIFIVQVTEQDVMDSMIIANRNGNIACTQGGESMAGLKKAVQEGLVKEGEIGILDSTAHMLKFISFQEMYFNGSFDPEFGVIPKKELQNAPQLVKPENLTKFPEPGKPLDGEDLKNFVNSIALEIAQILNLEKK